MQSTCKSILLKILKEQIRAEVIPQQHKENMYDRFQTLFTYNSLQLQLKRAIGFTNYWLLSVH